MVVEFRPLICLHLGRPKLREYIGVKKAAQHTAPTLWIFFLPLELRHGAIAENGGRDRRAPTRCGPKSPTEGNVCPETQLITASYD